MGPELTSCAWMKVHLWAQANAWVMRLADPVGGCSARDPVAPAMRYIRCVCPTGTPAAPAPAPPPAPVAAGDDQASVAALFCNADVQVCRIRAGTNVHTDLPGP